MSLGLPVLILGAGGHGRVLMDILRSNGGTLLGILDRDAALHGTQIDDLAVLGDDRLVAKYAAGAVLLANGLGNRARSGDSGLGARRALFTAFKANGYQFVSVVSRDATVSPRAILEEGCQIIARAVVHPGCVIGANAIVNTGAQVDHDCIIGAHSHVAPGAVLCGNVTVGVGSHIGAGAVVIEGVKIGAGAIVPAGCVVTREVIAGATVSGQSYRS
jgi:UDP-perosamine 4-acetyltransferase